MGFLDALLGGRKKLAGPAAKDRLFAMTTAYIAMDTGLGLKTAGDAGIVFQPLATADFDQILKDAKELLDELRPGDRVERSPPPTTSSVTAGWS